MFPLALMIVGMRTHPGWLDFDDMQLRQILFVAIFLRVISHY